MRINKRTQSQSAISSGNALLPAPTFVVSISKVPPWSIASWHAHREVAAQPRWPGSRPANSAKRKCQSIARPIRRFELTINPNYLTMNFEEYSIEVP
jgi:hypothetical protein